MKIIVFLSLKLENYATKKEEITNFLNLKNNFS